MKQRLLNLTLRLREAYIARSLREEQLAAVIADAAGPLRACASTLLELEGRASSSPQVENVATLIDPPGSDRDEASWLSAVVRNSESKLLLDLHNLHANALNFNFDAKDLLARIPVERIATIHLAGGRWIGREDLR